MAEAGRASPGGEHPFCVAWGRELVASRGIEPRILALGDELRRYGGHAAELAGLFALLGDDFFKSAAMLRRAAEVEGETGPAIELAARAIEEQQGEPAMPLGIALRRALEVTC